MERWSDGANPRTNIQRKRAKTSPAFVLTAEGVGETVPNAAPFSDEPPSLRAGREAERSPQHAHEQVADGNVNQQQVDGRPQHLVTAEEHEHKQVVDQSESTDEAEAHGHDQVSCRAEGGPVWTAPQVPFPGSGAQSAVELRTAAQAHVGHQHGSPCHCGGTAGGHGLNYIFFAFFSLLI